MELVTQRLSGGTNSTIGAFFIDCKFAAFTMEDEFRTIKVKGETRIPAGRYPVKLRTEGGFHTKYLAKFGADFHKGMLHVQNVPNFEYILIHILNTEKQTAGCLGVGNQATSNVKGDGYIGDSESAYKQIYPPIRDMLLRGEEVWITYKDEGQMDLS